MIKVNSSEHSFICYTIVPIIHSLVIFQVERLYL